MLINNYYTLIHWLWVEWLFFQAEAGIIPRGLHFELVFIIIELIFMTLWNVELFSFTVAFITLNTVAPSINQIAEKYKWHQEYVK